MQPGQALQSTLREPMMCAAGLSRLYLQPSTSVDIICCTFCDMCDNKYAPDRPSWICRKRRPR